MYNNPNIGPVYCFLSTSKETMIYLRDAIEKVKSFNGIFLIENEKLTPLINQMDEEDREEFDWYPFLAEGYSQIAFKKRIQ
jgi:hypothetical protein